MIDAGKPISVFGNGSSGRDYTFVDDTVPGIIASLDYDCQFDVFNLGNSSPVTLRTLIATIEEALGNRAEIRWLPDQPGDVLITYSNIGKAQRLLGYAPKVGLREVVGRLVPWHRRTTHAAWLGSRRYAGGLWNIMLSITRNRQ
jgi:UDP-glucuronate 4-epimerase